MADGENKSVENGIAVREIAPTVNAAGLPPPPPPAMSASFSSSTKVDKPKQSVSVVSRMKLA